MFFFDIWLLMFTQKGEIQLQPGSYHYSFQSYLPPQLPTSFEGDYGYIRYNACVVLDIPMWPDKEFETIFTVIKAINLNADPTLRVIYSFLFLLLISVGFCQSTKWIMHD